MIQPAKPARSTALLSSNIMNVVVIKKKFLTFCCLLHSASQLLESNSDDIKLLKLNQTTIFWSKTLVKILNPCIATSMLMVHFLKHNSVKLFFFYSGQRPSYILLQFAHDN